MIEVRFFAGVRKDRRKGLLPVSGFHRKPERALKDAAAVSLFPAVGGG